MKPLRVYGWNDDGVHRCIVAARSLAEAHRLASANRRGRTIGQMRDYGCWTGNAHEIEVATAKPGTVFKTNSGNRDEYKEERPL